MSKLIILVGRPYAGKTTLGRALRERFGHAWVDVDVIKERLHGSGLQDDDLTQKQWNEIYAETDREMEAHLRAGRIVVDDSRNFRKRERIGAQSIAKRAGAAFVAVYVDTPVTEIRQRAVANRLSPTRHDVPDPDLDKLLAAFEPPTADERPLILISEVPLQEWIEAHGAELS